MNQDSWIERWRENKIGFHRQGVNPHLERFWARVAAKAGEPVLVPLCGKSEDMRWLADAGQQVCGVELSAIAARAFGQEQKITFAEQQSEDFLILRSPHVQLYVGDFLKFTPSTAGTFPLFYDRAALIALAPEIRRRYAATLSSLLDAGARGIFITMEYDQTQMEGPPFSVTGEEVRSLFPGLRIEQLLSHDCLDEEPRFKERGVQWMREVVYLAHADGSSS